MRIVWIMSRAKKAKRDTLVTMYIRVKPEERARILEIAEVRGYPHTMSSVATEMISRGLVSSSNTDNTSNANTSAVKNAP